jgi:transcriptional antiterminator NusG
MTEEVASETSADWYIVHTYSGQEDRVKRNLEMRIESMDVKDKVFQVVIPTEEEIEIKDGLRKHVQRKIFPG